MKDEGGRSKGSFEERVQALLSKLTPEEAKVLRARFGPRLGTSPIDEERELEKLAHELAALKKRH